MVPSSPPRPAAAGGMGRRLGQRRAVAIAYVSAIFMTAMDMHIVNVALPTLGRVFGASIAHVQWTVVAYLLSLAVVIPASGWVGDRIGMKRAFLLALACFTAASALCGLAQSLGELVAARVLQGVGGGMLTPVGTALLFRTYPPEQRARVTRTLVVPILVAPASAPLVGGFLTQTLSWRWVFFVNIPVGVATLVLCGLALDDAREHRAGRLDVPGMALAAVGLSATVYAISEGPVRGWASAPGFVDVHVHGFGGVDFAGAGAQDYRRAGEALLRSGVTAFRPTFVTALEDELVESLRAVPDGDVGPRVLGCHLEGPFLSPRRLGMHPASARRDPDLALLERLLAAGPVGHVTLAPELPGALAAIDLLRSRGVTAACGHTDATAAEAYAAFDRGATHVTHLYNAMRPFSHRDPGIGGAALARGDVTVELILDGNHVSDEAALVALRAAAGRVVLVTDGMAAAGSGDGRWQMGAVEVEVRAGVVRTLDGTLAGSVLTMRDAVRSLLRLGLPLVQAVDAATRVPARAAGRLDLGRLAPGAVADVVVLDPDVEVTRTLVGGVER